MRMHEEYEIYQDRQIKDAEYIKKIHGLAMYAAHLGMENVDEFDLKKMFIFEELTQAAGLYIQKLEPICAMNSLFESGRIDQVGHLLTKLMINPSAKNSNETLGKLTDAMSKGVTEVVLEKIADDVNEMLSYAIETVSEYRKEAANSDCHYL